MLKSYSTRIKTSIYIILHKIIRNILSQSLCLNKINFFKKYETPLKILKLKIL
jgi:hypothetical protein